MQNQAQYNFDRKAAKISALSCNNLDKCEYLTGEDLGLKPSTIEQTKFKYSPLGKIFNKWLDKDDQKDGLFKRLKNIENALKRLTSSNNDDDDDDDDDDNDDDDKSIYCTSKSKFDDKDKMDSKPLNVFDYLKSLSQEAKDLIDEIEEANDDIRNGKLLFIGSNKEKFNFNTFNKPLNFISAIYNGEISLNEAEFKHRDLQKNRGAKRL